MSLDLDWSRFELLRSAGIAPETGSHERARTSVIPLRIVRTLSPDTRSSDLKSITVSFADLVQRKPSAFGTITAPAILAIRRRNFQSVSCH